MSFYTNLRKKLKSRLNGNELELLPRSYQVLGKILLIKLKPELKRQKKMIGKAVLEMFPYIHTVCLIKGIKEITRKPDIEVIAGCKEKKPVPSTQTLHKEYGCQFLLDVSEIMWSKGNKEERMRMTNLAKPGEIVVDMFAGIGYFSIFLAKYSKPEKIYSIDINPKAIEYLRKNVWLNNVENKIEILEGDCRKYADLLENTADRIIMGYLFDTEKFLPSALKIAKKRCLIHFHRIAKNEETEKIKEKITKIGEKEGCKIKIFNVRKVKSYKPKIFHFVFDLKINKLK